MVWTADWTSLCHYAGSFDQAGKLGSASTSYSCIDGEERNISFSEIMRHNGFIAGRFTGHAISNGCDYRDQFAGIVAN